MPVKLGHTEKFLFLPHWNEQMNSPSVHQLLDYKQLEDDPKLSGVQAYHYREVCGFNGTGCGEFTFKLVSGSVPIYSTFFLLCVCECICLSGSFG